nr:MAG TPA: hypothetical protein [Caudoviricetes sp.]
MPALFRRKIQGTEKGKKERREAAFRLDKSINLPTQGEGYAVSGEDHQSGNDHRGREILFKPV